LTFVYVFELGKDTHLNFMGNVASLWQE